MHTPRKDVDKLVFEEIARVSYHSAKAINFRLMNKDAVKKALEVFKVMERKPEKELLEIPSHLFDDVVALKR